MSEPIPFPQAYTDPADDATEVTPDVAPASAAPQRRTTRLPDESEILSTVTDLLTSPLDLLPAETRAHLKNAGREAALTFTSLSGTLLKGASIALNVAAETLKNYSDRNSAMADHGIARSRNRVEIDVE